MNFQYPNPNPCSYGVLFVWDKVVDEGIERPEILSLNANPFMNLTHLIFLPMCLRYLHRFCQIIALVDYLDILSYIANSV